MSTVDTSKTAPSKSPAWYTQDPDAVVAAFGTDRERGLTQAEAARRLADHGPNSIAAEKAMTGPMLQRDLRWRTALR